MRYGPPCGRGVSGHSPSCPRAAFALAFGLWSATYWLNEGVYDSHMVISVIVVPLTLTIAELAVLVTGGLRFYAGKFVNSSGYGLATVFLLLVGLSSVLLSVGSVAGGYAAYARARRAYPSPHPKRD